jgi:hypothetical protein
MVYFANSQHIHFLSDLLSCTTKLDKARVLYVCCAASQELRGLWSDLFNGSHLLVWSLTCFIRVLSVWSHTKNDMLYSRWTCHELWCRHVFHTCAFRMTNMRGKDTLHSNGGCLRLDAVHAAAWRMDTVSISERYCMWTLPWRAGTEGSFL